MWGVNGDFAFLAEESGEAVLKGKPSEWKLLSALTTKRMGVGTLRNWNTVRGLAEMIG